MFTHLMISNMYSSVRLRYRLQWHIWVFCVYFNKDSLSPNVNLFLKHSNIKSLKGVECVLLLPCRGWRWAVLFSLRQRHPYDLTLFNISIHRLLNEDIANVQTNSSDVPVGNGKAALFKDTYSHTSIHLDVSHFGIKMIFIIFLPD